MAHTQDVVSTSSQHIIYYAGYMPPQSLLAQPRVSMKRPSNNLSTSGGHVHIHDFSSAESTSAFRARFAAFKHAYDTEYPEVFRHSRRASRAEAIDKPDKPDIPSVTLVASRSAMTREFRYWLFCEF